MQVIIIMGDGNIERETEKAVLVDFGGQQWLPKSQIEIIRSEETHTVNIKMPAWLARKCNWYNSPACCKA